MIFVFMMLVFGLVGRSGVVSMPLGGMQQNGFRAFPNYFLTVFLGGCYSALCRVSSNRSGSNARRRPMKRAVPGEWQSC
jgi:hypothetical protein